MRSSEHDVISGFFNLVNCPCRPELFSSLNERQGCLSAAAKVEGMEHLANKVNIDISWDTTWLSLAMWVPVSWFTVDARQRLLQASPCHLQCAADRKGRLHLVSKFKRSEARQELLYQRYTFMLDRLKMAIADG